MGSQGPPGLEATNIPPSALPSIAMRESRPKTLVCNPPPSTLSIRRLNQAPRQQSCPSKARVSTLVMMQLNLH